jgi:hypothetical protein
LAPAWATSPAIREPRCRRLSLVVSNKKKRECYAHDEAILVSTSEFIIDPDSKVAALLEHYPALEEVLIELAPPFRKLRNPVLRRSVARVASLKQAAAVGGLPVADLVNALREAVGQSRVDEQSMPDDLVYFGERPEWFDPARVVRSIDEESVGPEIMPLKPVLQEAGRLRSGEILALSTTFLPAPGIDLVRGKGFLVWPVREADGSIKTYVTPPA